MEIFEWLQNEITDLLSEFIRNSLITGACFAILGLFISIRMIQFARKRQWLKRPLKFWRFIANLNYVYTPVCIMSFLGIVGTIWGAQWQVNRWIDRTTDPIIQYGQVFLPQLQYLGSQLEQAKTLEEALLMEFPPSPGAGPMERQFEMEFNRAIVQAALRDAGYPTEIDGLIRFLREQNLSALSAHSLRSIPRFMKRFIGTYFSDFRSSVFHGYRVYLGIPILELLLYLLYLEYFTGLLQVNTKLRRITEGDERSLG